MKPNRLRIKTRLAVRHARSIRMGIRDLVNIDQILDAWYGLHHPELSEQMSVSGFQGRDWARMYISIRDTDKLYEALGRLYADTYVYSEDITAYEMARAVGLRKAINFSQERLQSALKTQWDNWRPGNRAAAALLDPPDGLRRLLEQRNLTIRGLASTTIDRIGTRLADGLRQGLTRDQIARSINEVLNDSTRSITIAQTEMARAVIQANEQIYRESGVTMVEYLVVDPCAECQENLKASPLPLGEDWPMGNPPVHPNCMCEPAPYITMEVPEEPVSQVEQVTQAVEDISQVLPFIPQQTSVITPVDYSDLKFYTQQEQMNLQRFQSARGYTEKNLPTLHSEYLREYVGYGYTEFNIFLREQAAGKPISSIHDDMMVGKTKILSDMISNAPTLESDVVTYRGVRSSYASTLKELGVGSIYQEPAFVSTTLDFKTAHAFAAGGSPTDDRVLLQIISPKGTKGLMVDGFISTAKDGFALGTGEMEWLLPPGSRFEIVSSVRLSMPYPRMESSTKVPIRMITVRVLP